jgi:hypothetical protein
MNKREVKREPGSPFLDELLALAKPIEAGDLRRLDKEIDERYTEIYKESSRKERVALLTLLTMNQRQFAELVNGDLLSESAHHEMKNYLTYFQVWAPRLKEKYESAKCVSQIRFSIRRRTGA